MELLTKTPELDTKVTKTRSTANTILWFFAPLALMLIHIFLRFSEFDPFPSFCRVDFLYFNPTFLEIARSTGVAVFLAMYVLTSIVAVVIFVLVSATMLFRRHARGAAIALLLGTLIFYIPAVWFIYQPESAMEMGYGQIRASIPPEACDPRNAVEFAECMERKKGTNDTDLDKIPNEADNCPHTVNPDQADENKDGTGDACDRCTQTREYYRQYGL